MNILVLHALNRRSRKIKSVIEQELMFPNIDQNNDYHVHNARIPMTSYQKNINYDAIIVTSSFIDLLTSDQDYRKIYSEFEFLSKSAAFKVAFPQDDYWLSDVRDKWYCDMNINIVFPVCQKKHWDYLYPKYSSIGKFMQGYTGYVHDRHFWLAEKTMSMTDRRIDVVYRATKIPLFPNYLGFLKGNLGSNFEHLCIESNSILRIDVEGKPKKGNQWEKLLSNSRTVLGSPSGSSTLVRNWTIADLLRSINGLTELNVENELEKQIPSELLGKHFTAISPRNIEAAATGTVQVLAGGNYGDILEPLIDFIPFDFEMESLAQLEHKIFDAEIMEQISRSCWRTLSSKPELIAKNHVNIILRLISSEKPIGQKKKIQRNFSPKFYVSKSISKFDQCCISIFDFFKMYLFPFTQNLRKVIFK